jgi:phospholipid:diacylglycerol acyltransferase
MSFLRRRFGGGESSTEPSREPSPAPASAASASASASASAPERPSNLRLVTAEQLHTLQKKGKRGKRKNAWVFGLGGIFGLILAAFFAGNNDYIDLPSLEGMNLESIMEALPANFVRSAQQLQVRYDTCSTARRPALIPVASRKTNAMPSTTTRSPSACTHANKASAPHIPSS